METRSQTSDAEKDPRRSPAAANSPASAPPRPPAEIGAGHDTPHPPLPSAGFSRPDPLTGRILIIEDNVAVSRVIQDGLRHAGYRHIDTLNESREAPLRVHAFKPDVILLDLQMPGRDGFQVMEDLKQTHPEDPIPVIVISGDLNPSARHRALLCGAQDFVAKPFSHFELLLRIRNVLSARLCQLRLEDLSRELMKQLEDRTREVGEARMEALRHLRQCAIYRNHEGGAHMERIATMAALVARKLGLPEVTARRLGQAAALHDIGEIGIPDTVLLKPGPLTPVEFDLMKSHTLIGACIIGCDPVETVTLAHQIALGHHERWDGSGYPAAVAGEEIPLSARIVGACDTLDALWSERPYRKAWPREEAWAEVARQAGRKLDPRVVEAMLDLRGEIDALRP